MNRADLMRRCRALECAFIRLQAQTGRNHSIGIQWARQWAQELMFVATPAALYANWIEQQEARVVSLIRKSHEADRAFKEAGL